MIDLVISWLSTGIGIAFQEFVNFFSSVFDYDVTEFNNTFTFAAVSYDVITDIALGIVALLAVWQVVMFFFAGADKAPSNPIRIALNTVIAIGFIYYGNYLLELILEFCQYPYNTLQELEAQGGGLIIGDSLNPSKGEIISLWITSSLPTSSTLLYLILLLMLCYNFVKLLLEIIERYCWTFVLLYLSPLAAATLASTTTSGIYKKFIAMFISQCLLLFLNEWCLKMACSGLILTNNGDTTNMVSLLLCYAFLRLSSQMDTYINQLGLNAVTTGAGLGAEIIGAGISVASSASKLSGGAGSSFGGGNSGAGNPILGAAKLAGTYAKRVDPISAVGKLAGDAAIGGVHGASEAFRTMKWDKQNAPAQSQLNNPSPATPVNEGSSPAPVATATNGSTAAASLAANTPAGATAPATAHNNQAAAAGDTANHSAEEHLTNNTPAPTPVPAGAANAPATAGGTANHSTEEQPVNNTSAPTPVPAGAADMSVSNTETDNGNAPEENQPTEKNDKKNGKPTIFQAAGKGIAQSFRTSDNLISRSFNKLGDSPNYEERLHNALTDSGDPKQRVDHQESLEAWGNHSHLAQSAVTHVQKTNAVIDDPEKIAAITKGLGAGAHSKEAAEFIQVGFDRSPEIPDVGREYKMDNTGIHAQYDTRDGYRHNMDLYDQAQYSRLSMQQREGLDKFTTSDGHRYYMRVTKTKREPISNENKGDKTATANNAANNTEETNNTQANASEAKN